MAVTHMTAMSFRVERGLKSKADELFAELGLNTSTALNMFLRQAVRHRAIPFEISAAQPNAETVEAMREAERISCDPKAKGFRTMDTLMKDLY